MKRTLLSGYFILFFAMLGYGQSATTIVSDTTVVFRFPIRSHKFYVPYRGNDAEMERLFSFVEHYKSQIDVVEKVKDLEKEPQAPVEIEQHKEIEQPQEPETAKSPIVIPLFIRTNFLYWLVATPNLSVEWRPSGSFGILVNGLWSHWIWSNENRQHRSWMISPEVRYYIGENKNWFIGAEGHIGEFNYKLSPTGYQGDAVGAGLTGGYKLRLNKTFDLDFSLGLGYTHLKYETYYRAHYRSNGNGYTVNDSYMVRKEAGLKKNLFGPTQAGVSLIWKIN